MAFQCAVEVRMLLSPGGSRMLSELGNGVGLQKKDTKVEESELLAILGKDTALRAMISGPVM